MAPATTVLFDPITLIPVSPTPSTETLRRVMSDESDINTPGPRVKDTTMSTNERCFVSTTDSRASAEDDALLTQACKGPAVPLGGMK